MNKKDNQKQSWFNFYLSRVDSAEYEKHFYEKYGLFIEIIKSLSVCGLIKEEGIGIGSITKALGGINTYGSDICDNMLRLCKLNNPNTTVFIEDILSKDKSYKPNTAIVVTHGVLEHFSDRDIYKILNGYQKKVLFSVHYVPTNKYKEPSFGDERLLSTQYWVQNFNPYWYSEDNEGKDLYLIFKHK